MGEKRLSPPSLGAATRATPKISTEASNLGRQAQGHGVDIVGRGGENKEKFNVGFGPHFSIQLLRAHLLAQESSEKLLQALPSPPEPTPRSVRRLCHWSTLLGIIHSDFHSLPHFQVSSQQAARSTNSEMMRCLYDEGPRCIVHGSHLTPGNRFYTSVHSRRLLAPNRPHCENRECRLRLPDLQCHCSRRIDNREVLIRGS